MCLYKLNEILSVQVCIQIYMYRQCFINTICLSFSNIFTCFLKKIRNNFKAILHITAYFMCLHKLNELHENCFKILTFSSQTYIFKCTD